MQPKYSQWIEQNVTEVVCRCAETTLAMSQVFPELRRVRGHYVCPLTGSQPHWWLVDEEGEIVDPTATQFAPCGVYIEWVGKEPTGRCLNCGRHVFDGEYTCSAVCSADMKTTLGG